MRAMVLNRISDLTQPDGPLELLDVPNPVPDRYEILVRVSACGVCHTELDIIEGRTPPLEFPVIPGHEVIGEVVALGDSADRFVIGDRVGIGWIHSSDGGEQENVSPAFRATGRDVNGGYAELMTVPQDYAYPIPGEFDEIEAAPLLCAGGVGYRALKLSRLENGQVLGLTGFGGSGHLVLQLSKYLYPDSPVYVFARSQKERAFASELGADWCGDTEATPPSAAHAIIDTTPAWKPVLAALERLRPAGRLVINAIRKEDADRELMAGIRYEDHLWHEKEIKTVANVTRRDIAEFLPIAAAVPLHVATTTFALEEANAALRQLRAGHIRGAYVLRID